MLTHSLRVGSLALACSAEMPNWEAKCGGSLAKFSPLPTACMIPRPCRAWSPPNPSSLSPIPSKTRTHDVIGSLYVLDTGPLQITEKQKEMLLWIAEVVITAIGLQKAVPPLGPILEIGI